MLYVRLLQGNRFLVYLLSTWICMQYRIQDLEVYLSWSGERESLKDHWTARMRNTAHGKLHSLAEADSSELSARRIHTSRLLLSNYFCPLGSMVHSAAHIRRCHQTKRNQPRTHFL